MDEDALLKGSLVLSTLVNSLAGTLGVTTEDKLSLQLPLLVDVPVSLCLLVDDGVVVLEVGGAAFGLEGGPEVVLVHGCFVHVSSDKVEGAERRSAYRLTG